MSQHLSLCINSESILQCHMLFFFLLYCVILS
nr:MAG TPA: hypothetical protein [Bacteriophage sp.]